MHGGGAVEILGRAATRLPVGLLHELHARLPQEGFHELGDRGCTRHAGGLDAGGVEQAVCGRGGCDEEVIEAPDDRSSAREGAHDASRIEVGDELAGAREQGFDVGCVGVAVTGVAQSGRGGDHRVVVDGSRHDDALGDGRGRGRAA